MKTTLLSAMIWMTALPLQAGDILSAGQKAPDFTLYDFQGNAHNLTDYAGKKVVLYFYPKDDTPGCTAEACNLRDNYSLLQEKGLVVLGISFDDADSHQAFTQKYNLPFTLLSDPDKKTAEAYGAKRGGLLSFIGARRITFLIDEKGTVLHVFDDVKTKSHSEQILQFLKGLK
jgi:peroxiredoxin Q/BCP